MEESLNPHDLREKTQDPTPEDEQNLQTLGRFLLDENSSWPEQETLSPTPESPPSSSGSEAYPLRSDGVQQRVLKVSAADNPLLEAIQPLLRALSDMPDKMENLAHVVQLKQTLRHEITLFSVVCDEVNIPWKKMAIVRFCICTALDEAVHTTAWGLSAGWSQSNLLNHFEGDNDGGNKFFLLIGRLSMNPNDFIDVLEILLLILGLGFEGRYSIIEDGDRQLNKIRQRLLTLVQSTRETSLPVLSPHGLQPRGPQKRQRLMIPVRLTAMCAAMLIAASFIWCKYRLLADGQRVGDAIYALQSIKRVAPPKAMPLRLSVLLKDEIQKRLLSVDETQRQSKVVLKGDSVFLPGSIRVQPEMAHIIQRVAREVRRVNGDVTIIGYTDAIAIHRQDIPNNTVLSEKRAGEVANFFKAAGLPVNRIKIKGAGDSEPVATNSTAQGRAMNRRVEFFVTY